MKKVKKWGPRVIATLLMLVFAVNSNGIKSQAKEPTMQEVMVADKVVSNVAVYNSDIQLYTTMSNCEITLAFTANGLEMSFSTSSFGNASVIGVKDIKVQQKMWYGWKTVKTSSGAENYDASIFMGELIYPDAVEGKTYRVTCVHYADCDGYEEVENDTGAFKFVRN